MGGPVRDERAARLSELRTLLGRTTQAWGERSALEAGGRTLPLAAPLRPLLAGGGLRRGGTVAVESSIALVLALLAEASAAGAWCALVGLPEVGLVAAAEAGLAPGRLALVPRPGAELVAVTIALLDGLDLVAVAGGQRLSAGDRQRLSARARHCGSVLLPVGSWPGADVRLGVESGRWAGLGDSGGGAGRLRCRRVRVRASGRGSACHERVSTLLLPGPDGMAAESSWPGERLVPPLAQEAG